MDSQLLCTVADRGGILIGGRATRARLGNGTRALVILRSPEASAESKKSGKESG